MKIVFKNTDLEFQAYSEVELEVTQLGYAYVRSNGVIATSSGDSGYYLFYATNEEFRKIKVSDYGIFAMSDQVPTIGGTVSDLGGGNYRIVNATPGEAKIDLPIDANYIIICSTVQSVEISGIY